MHAVYCVRCVVLAYGTVTRSLPFVGKVSGGGGRDRLDVAHRHKIGHLVSYLEIPCLGHSPCLPGTYHPGSYNYDSTGVRQFFPTNQNSPIIFFIFPNL